MYNMQLENAGFLNDFSRLDCKAISMDICWSEVVLAQSAQYSKIEGWLGCKDGLKICQ